MWGENNNVTLQEALRRRVAQELELDTEAALSSFNVAILRRGVASNGRVAFEPGDVTLVDGAPADQARAYSFRERRMVALTRPSYDPVDQILPAPEHAYEVNLKHVGALDSDLWQQVHDLPAASSCCSAYIAENAIGAEAWTGGIVRDALTRIPVAYVSHGGRVWPGQPGTEEMDTLYDPGAPGSRGP